MSAIKDSQQGIIFNYSNFYQLYRKGKLANQDQKELATGVVLNTRSLVETPAVAEIRVVSSQQTEELSQWSHGKQDAGKKEMASNLKSLRDARKRLVFLMSEIEDVLKRS